MTEETTAAEKKTMNCSNCGAPIEYVEGESVLTCNYCGTTTMLAGFDNIIRIESHFILPPVVNGEESRAKVFNWMKKGVFKTRKLCDNAVWNNEEGIVLPFWVVRNAAKTFWRGMNKKTRTTGSGDKQKSEEYWEPVSGNFSDNYNWPIYARENDEEFWGLEVLKPGRKKIKADWGKFFLNFGLGSKTSRKTDLLKGKEAFDLEKIKGMKIINGQITQDRAEDQAKNEVIELHVKKSNAKATKITDCDTTVTVNGVDLVYGPMWEFEYSFENKNYHVLVNGHTGEIVAGEAPVGHWVKVTVLSIQMMIMAAISAALAKNGGSPFWIAAGVFAGIALIYAIWTAFFRKKY